MSGRWIPSQRRRKHTQKLPQLRKVPASQGVGPVHKADCVCIGCRAIRDDAETRKRGEAPATYSTHQTDTNRLLRIADDGSRAELLPDGTLVPVGMQYKTGGVSSTLNGWTISTDPGLFSSIEITETFCSADAPEGFTNPGFLANFTLGSGDCEDCTGCVGFGTDGAECNTVDLCGCTGIPTTLTLTISAPSCGSLSGLTIPLVYNSGTGNWSGTDSGTVCGSERFSASLNCGGSLPADFAFQMSSGLCSNGGGFWTAVSQSCSPFQLVFSSTFTGGCPCCSGVTVTATVTA